MKKCSKCGETKDISEFHKSKQHSTGYKSQCKCCIKVSSLIYNDKNKDAISVKHKLYYQENCSKLKKQNKEWRNSDKGKVKTKEYYHNNKDKNKQSAKKWQHENKEYFNNYYKNKRINDISFKITTNLRRKTNKMVKGKYKTASTKELLGCDIENLRLHMKKQFYDRSTGEQMTWDNYGYYGWHIDHRLPCADFDLTDPEQQKECFHYTNLQPLWAEDNLAKSDKLNWTKGSI